MATRFSSVFVGLALAVLGAVCAPAPALPPAADEGEETEPKGRDRKGTSSREGDDAEPAQDDRDVRAGLDAFPGSKLFTPPQMPAPGIVMLHGSEGGDARFVRDFAAEIAKQGFVVVTMCWFGCKGRPPRIVRIPLEGVLEIGRWLEGSSGVGGRGVGLFGWSRGAEMALIVGSKADTAPFRAIAVHAPSDTVVAAFDPATQDQSPDFGSVLEKDANGRDVPAPAWTWKGAALFGETDPEFRTPGPPIAVTKFTGPVYVSQGEQDEVWEVTRGKNVVARRKAVASLVTESHFFPGEGHVLERPENVAARRTEVVAFFRKHLAKE